MTEDEWVVAEKLRSSRWGWTEAGNVGDVAMGMLWRGDWATVAQTDGDVAIGNAVAQ
jgi:hypothetical protein